jgi:hypothetical protein
LDSLTNNFCKADSAPCRLFYFFREITDHADDADPRSGGDANREQCESAVRDNQRNSRGQRVSVPQTPLLDK